MIFLCDTFSGARGMLNSLRNHQTGHEAGSATCRHNQPEEMADCLCGPM